MMWKNGREFSPEERAALGRRRFYVTGASGYVGREICCRLAELGAEVHGLVGHLRQEALWPETVEITRGDILEATSLREWLAEAGPEDVLIHSAALISVRKHAPQCERVNLEGTRNVLAAFRERGMGRLLYIGSVDALTPDPKGRPIREPAAFHPEMLPTSYGRSKAAACQAVLDAAAEGVPAGIILPSAVAGPGDYRDGFITTMLRIYLSLTPRISIQGGYEFVDVRDVADGVISAALLGAAGEVYILSSRYASVTEIFNMVAARLGRKPVLMTLPLGLLYCALPFMGAWYGLKGKEPPLSAAAVTLMREHPAYDHSKAERELGFRPRPILDTITDETVFLLRRRAEKREKAQAPRRAGH